MSSSSESSARFAAPLPSPSPSRSSNGVARGGRSGGGGDTTGGENKGLVKVISTVAGTSWQSPRTCPAQAATNEFCTCCACCLLSNWT
eukprot:2969747-Pleurochrysis_carterae.AAC.1